MEAINFINRYKKKYIGNINYLYFDNNNHNYLYYKLLLNTNKQKEYLIFILDDKYDKYYLKLIGEKIIYEENYIIDDYQVYYKNGNYIKNEFNYKITINNNKLKILFDVNVLLDYLSYPDIEFYLYVPYKYNFINKIKIINNIQYEHPYSCTNIIKRINIYFEYMPNLTNIFIKNCNVKYGYIPLLKNINIIDEDKDEYY